MKHFGKVLVPAVAVFIFVTVLVFATNTLLKKYNIDKNILLAANLLFLLLSVLVAFILKKSMANPNPNVFVRSVIGAMMIKMFAVIIAVLVYVLSVGNLYDKKAVFISLFIYLVYLSAEVWSVSKELRKKNA